MDVLGVIGNPIAHSLSPVMHNNAFSASRRDAIYVPLLVEDGDLSKALAGARALGFLGLNVTIPYKEKVIPYLTDLTEEAKQIGSVNTILFANQRSYGHTTDGPGFRHSMAAELSISPKGNRFLVLGAGGSARAIVHQLVKEDCYVTIANRTQERAEALVAELMPYAKGVLQAVGTENLASVARDANIIVNTTSAGMKATIDVSPIALDLLHKEHTVIDIIYNPQETVLLHTAKKLGCQVQNGVGMLVWQAAVAWDFWWQQQPPIEVMYQAVNHSLNEVK